MPSNKDRLYITLHARGSSATPEDTYHWALLVGPKVETEGGEGRKFHVKNKVTGPEQIEWIFDPSKVPLTPTNMLLVRIIVAKIKDSDRVLGVLEGIPLQQGTPGWTCKSWVREALEALKGADGVLGRNEIEWEKMHEVAMTYCGRKKKEGRFNGKGDFDTTKPPTYDMIEDREVIP